MKEQPDSWWADVLPPEGYIGPYNSDSWDSWWMDRFSGDHGNEYYCTELVWAAYFQSYGEAKYHHYLEKNPDALAIRGWELEHDDDVYIIPGGGQGSGGALYYDDK